MNPHNHYHICTSQLESYHHKKQNKPSNGVELVKEYNDEKLILHHLVAGVKKMAQIKIMGSVFSPVDKKNAFHAIREHDVPTVAIGHKRLVRELHTQTLTVQ